MTCAHCDNPAIHTIEDAHGTKTPSCGVHCNEIIREAEKSGVAIARRAPRTDGKLLEVSQ